MTYLLDTSVFILASSQSSRLSKNILSVLLAPEARLFLSVASLWEIVIKVSIGRLSFPVEKFEESLEALDLQLLPINVPDLLTLNNLPAVHKDPFDRLLIAQAITGQMRILTTDRQFKGYEGVEIIS